jgi:hypothetical protein
VTAQWAKVALSHGGLLLSKMLHRHLYQRGSKRVQKLLLGLIQSDGALWVVEGLLSSYNDV